MNRTYDEYCPSCYPRPMIPTPQQVIEDRSLVDKALYRLWMAWNHMDNAKQKACIPTVKEPSIKPTLTLRYDNA